MLNYLLANIFYLMSMDVTEFFKHLWKKVMKTNIEPKIAFLVISNIPSFFKFWSKL
jgi:hypothetical protein